MSVTPLPDVLKSAVEYLKTIPEVVAITNTAAGWNTGSGIRIRGALHKDWKVPTQAIIIRRAGGQGSIGAGLHRTRLDVWFMGANAYEAVNLWRTAHPALCPDWPGGATPTGWTAAGCMVTDVVSEGDPIPADDLEVGWSILVGTYTLTWREAPVS